ncbi:hypothetical protein C8F04DRAFT_1110142 [Mycena alexandri]|uniref:RING-type domain-containing protein n=1 Tax=Mycena alexandri TaxID=1745969 RepID=A0AAD6SSC9_9AGAR|nr:hypothetical protein C8F04DRAFT_1110142 [Mycena alexandri]
MPSNTRSTKLTRQSSDVVMLTNPALASKRRKDPVPKQKNPPAARKENHCPINSGEIIEISSDEDEEPVIPVATSQLRERIRQLEKENELMKKENEEMKKQQVVTADLEEQVTCEVCSSKMWSPFILPDCGHTFCQTDLENWFATALKLHRNVYPHYNVNAPAVNAYGLPGAVNPYNPYGLMQQIPLPAYSCPKCREKVRSKPIQNFALKSLVRAVAGPSGETSPKKVVGGSNNVWSRFFPA